MRKPVFATLLGVMAFTSIATALVIPACSKYNEQVPAEAAEYATEACIGHGGLSYLTVFRYLNSAESHTIRVTARCVDRTSITHDKVQFSGTPR